MNIDSLSKTILKELEEVFSRVDSNAVDSLMDAVIKAKRIFFIGVGREGMATRAFAMRVMHMGKECHWAWDDTTPNVGPEDLFVITSGSGEIGHIHFVAEMAKAAGATIAVVTGTPDRKTPAVADLILWVPACVYKGKDNVVPSIQPMGCLFEQSLFILFDMMIIMMAEKQGISFDKMAARHRNIE